MVKCVHKDLDIIFTIQVPPSPLDIFLWLTYRNQDLFFNNADLANNFKHSTGSQRPIEPPGTTANFRIHGRTRAVLTARGRETDELNLELADAEW